MFVPGTKLCFIQSAIVKRLAKKIFDALIESQRDSLISSPISHCKNFQKYLDEPNTAGLI